jgi:hypothetical protein
MAIPKWGQGFKACFVELLFILPILHQEVSG